MRIRIVGSDLPGRWCGPSPEHPQDHHNIHVAIQGRGGQHDLHGPVPGDAPQATWELECQVPTSPPDGDPPVADVRGPQIHGSPGKRFIYLTWGIVDEQDDFAMFRRAKLGLDDVPIEVMARACARGLLVGRLGLSDDQRWPLCGAVKPPRISWTAPEATSVDRTSPPPCPPSVIGPADRGADLRSFMPTRPSPGRHEFWDQDFERNS